MAGLGNSAVSGVVSKVAESVFDVIGRHISYVFKYQSYMDDLKQQVEQDLKNKRQRVEVDINEAGRQGEEIYNDVKQWLNDVDKFIEEIANPVFGDEEKSKKRCFKWLCPDYIKRYTISKAAVKAAKNGADLLGKGNFSRVSHRPAPQRTNSIYDRGDEGFDSRESNLEGVIGALKDADSKIIGVWGMGGVGKTTLVKKVASKVMEDKLFDTVVVAEVTQTIDYKKIKEKIAYDLDLEFGLESEFERAGRIRDRLKKEKRVLIILDDLWGKVDLEALGICVRDFEKGSTHQTIEREGTDDKERWRKILLTSRKQNVLQKDMNTEKIIFISPLSPKEALDWFWKIAGVSSENSDFHSIAVQIVEKCAGLPLAIATIATALNDMDLEHWKDALKQLKRCNLGNPSDPQSMHSITKYSYDLLKDPEAKLLFQLYGLFDTGSSTHIDDLLYYGMGLEWFKNYTLEEGRNRLYTLISDLKASCLLLDDFYQWFKMHDIIHAFAVLTASTKGMVNLQNLGVLKEELEENIPEDATAVSMFYTDIDELPEKLRCKNLEFFILFAKDPSLEIPDTFFEGTKELKVLDLSDIHLPSLPSSLCDLTSSLRTLCLDGCRLGDIGKIGQLRKLEILTFRYSDIKLLPAEIGKLTRLRSLALSNCSQLKVITPNVISNLSRLEELYMDNSFVDWEVEGLNNQLERCNASLGELKNLSRMTTLMIHIKHAQYMPQDLFSQQQLKRFRIFIGGEWIWSSKYESCRMLKLNLNNSIHLRPGITTLLKKAEDLFLYELSGVRDHVFELDGEGFPNLKYLHVKRGPELLYVGNAKGKVPCNALPMLESLFLHNLIKLEKICQGQLSKGSFRKLKLLEVCKCDSLRYIFTPPVVMGLEQLQKMTIEDCDMLEEIITTAGEKDSVARDKIIFHLLDTIILNNLSNLKSFYSGSNILEFPSLKSINMDRCLKMETFVYNDKKDLQLYPSPLFGDKVELPILESLEVSGCHSLQCMFSSSIVKSLSQLKTLRIERCEAMEAVLVVDEERIINEMPLFPRLQVLKLKDVYDLRRFYNFSGDLIELSDTQPFFDKQVTLPSLEKLFITNISNNLRRLWPNKFSLESFGKLKELRVSRCKSLEEIVSCIEEETIVKEDVAEAVPMFVFPHLISLRLWWLPNLMNFYKRKHISKWPKLEYLMVGMCGRVQIFMGFQNIRRESSNMIPIEQPLFSIDEVEFPNLEKLEIIGNKNLRKLWPNKLNLESFGKLKQLRIHDCKSLEEIVYCMEEEIVAKEEAAEAVPTFVFPHLILLDMRRLPNLTDFYLKKHISKWPKLKHLRVARCNKVQLFMGLQDTESPNTIPIQQPLFLIDKVPFPRLKELELSRLSKSFHLWKKHSQPSNVFQNLRTLRVSCSHNLEIILPSTVNFQNLTTLEVFQCCQLINLLTFSIVKSLVCNSQFWRMRCHEMLEEIIANSEGQGKDGIIFMQLKDLKPHNLPSLTSFA